jgi:hypothetical protein
VTSDVQFRKGASIPPFLVGLGWADRRFSVSSEINNSLAKTKIFYDSPSLSVLDLKSKINIV